MTRRIEGVFSAIGDWLEKEVRFECLKAKKEMFMRIESQIERRLAVAVPSDHDVILAILNDVRAIATMMEAEE